MRILLIGSVDRRVRLRVSFVAAPRIPVIVRESGFVSTFVWAIAALLVRHPSVNRVRLNRLEQRILVMVGRSLY